MSPSGVDLAVLLPVRNGEEDLPGWLRGAARFADAVVALDDGSTDRTAALLAASPLVATVLSNPVRPGYHGWDDAANRRRLLDAAAALRPRFVLWLDADERLDDVDAAALHRFVRGEALPGLAYGFSAHRMWGDLGHHEAEGYWVYRLFAWEPGQRLPDRRLHFDPIPTSIPRSRWLRTELRIQHLAGLTPERRAARRAKYREADARGDFPYGSQELGDAADGVRPWEPRPAGASALPVARDEPVAEEEPVLSAIVIARDDAARIERAVAAVTAQEAPWPFEVIVVTSGHDRTAELVRGRFPGVTVVELPHPALPGEARNAGVRVARGEYVSFPGSHVVLPPGSLAARIAAHDLGYAMVTGTTLNGTDTRAGWAAYFLDHSTVLPGRPSGELDGAPAHCSYLRDAVRAVGGFREDLRAGEDTVMNRTLAGQGHRAYRAAEVRLVHHTPCRTPVRLMRHFSVRGRGYGRILLDERRHDGRLLRVHTPRELTRALVTARVAAIDAHVAAWGGAELVRAYRGARPLVRLAALAHLCGALAELARPARGRLLTLVGRPVISLELTGGTGAGRAGAPIAVRVDAVARRVKVVRAGGEVVPGSLTRAPALRADRAHVRLTDAPAGSRAARRGLALIAAARGLPAIDRLSLLVALRGVPRGDVHVVELAEALERLAGPEGRDDLEPEEVARVTERCLDTRGLGERRRASPGLL